MWQQVSGNYNSNSIVYYTPASGSPERSVLWQGLVRHSVTPSLRYVPSPLITQKVTGRFPPFLVCESVMSAPTRPCSYFWPTPPPPPRGGRGTLSLLYPKWTFANNSKTIDFRANPVTCIWISTSRTTISMGGANPLRPPPNCQK